ncbi:MAG TPA: orotidine 5'-phosphate decarboxylase / HUMPS family protein, partial [Patescibacteria group bacterium]|nr:orotidine 5'-phosphate decarboxylase / HUMPS family protein [Patescibacteria group bacterium]
MPVLTLEQLPQPAQRIIPALDQDTWPEATASLLDIGNRISIGKVNSLADRHMDLAVKKLAGLGLLTMLDFKTLDIDMTMRKRTRQQTLAGASLLTVHAQNTVNALKDAIKGAEDALVIDPKLVRPLILGVTVLTTINDKDRDKGNNPIETCTSIYGASRMTKVRDFAYHAVDAGLDGLVCSPHEAEMLKN